MSEVARDASTAETAAASTPAKRPGRLARMLRYLTEPARALRLSAGLTLVALFLMVWSMVVPTPMPVMIAMTLGQGIGTLAFALFGFVIFIDLRRARRDKRDHGSFIPETPPEIDDPERSS